MHSSHCMAVGRSENLGGSSNLMGMISPPPLIEIGLTNLSKSGGAIHGTPDSDRPASGETKSYCICSDFKSLPTYAAAPT